jgi:hypothetical protein
MTSFGQKRAADDSDITYREADAGIRKTGGSPGWRSDGVSQNAASLPRLTTPTTSAIEDEGVYA